MTVKLKSQPGMAVNHGIKRSHTEFCQNITFHTKIVHKKYIDATACRAWPRAETLNGLQKVLQILHTQKHKT